MTLPEAIEQVKNEGISLSELSQLNTWLAGEFAFLSGKYAEVLIARGEIWKQIREDHTINSDTQADRAWESTPLGKEEIKLKHELKAIGRMLTSTRSRIEVMQGESRNLY